jgi:hypothetical protein
MGARYDFGKVKRVALFVVVLLLLAFGLVGVDALSDSGGAISLKNKIQENVGGFLNALTDYAVFLAQNNEDNAQNTDDNVNVPDATSQIVDNPGSSGSGSSNDPGSSGGDWSTLTNVAFVTPPDLGAMTLEEMISTSGNPFGNTTSSGESPSSVTFPFGIGGFPFPANVGCEMSECSWQESTESIPSLTSEPLTSDDPGTLTDEMGWPLGSLTSDSTQVRFDEPPADSIPEPLLLLVMGAALAALTTIARTTLRRV